MVLMVVVGRGGGAMVGGLRGVMTQHSAFSLPSPSCWSSGHTKSGAFCLRLTPLALRFPPSAYTCLGRNKTIEETGVLALCLKYLFSLVLKISQ